MTRTHILVHNAFILPHNVLFIRLISRHQQYDTVIRHQDQPGTGTRCERVKYELHENIRKELGPKKLTLKTQHVRPIEPQTRLVLGGRVGDHDCILKSQL